MTSFNRTFHYAALGDSLTVGIGTILFHPNFVDWYVKFSEKALHAPIVWSNFARSGATIKDVVESLNHFPTRKAVEGAEIITITAGGNDLIHAAFDFFKTGNEKAIEHNLIESQANCQELVERIYNIKREAKQPYIIRTINLYNPFPEYEIVDRWVRMFNAHVESCFSKLPNSKIADAYSLFKGHEHEWLKGVHPNEAGYFQMAKAINRLGYSPLIH